MLHILLLILKIIGIILGTLLAVLLTGLCLALFVPVRYRIEAGRTEAEGALPVEASVKVTWLLHLVNIRIRYPADVYLRARIFLFTVFRLPRKPKKERAQKAPDKKKNDKKEPARKRDGKDIENTAPVRGGGQKPPEPEVIQEQVSAQEPVSVQKPEPAQGQVSVQEPESAQEQVSVQEPESVQEPVSVQEPESGQEQVPVQEPEPAQEPEAEKQKIPFQKKLREKIMQIRRIFQKIWYTLTGICDKIKTIWENIEYYMGILQSDAFKRAFSLCKGELFSVFSYIRPRKFQADLTIGMDDPAATGKILSYYGMLYPLIGGCVNVIPDFERKRIEGTVFIKGKIRLFTFIKAALRIYFNKDIRKLLRLFKKEDL